jgi:hypothetical protein
VFSDSFQATKLGDQPATLQILSKRSVMPRRKSRLAIERKLMRLCPKLLREEQLWFELMVRITETIEQSGDLDEADLRIRFWEEPLFPEPPNGTSETVHLR